MDLQLLSSVVSDLLQMAERRPLNLEAYSHPAARHHPSADFTWKG
jgi:hypothetical protein